MIKRLDIGSLRLTFSLNTIIKVVGVNSYVGVGQHILMWDFDHNSLEEVKESLRVVQSRYLLSDIHICQTGKTRGYHAYCFTVVDWRRAVEILASTPHIDLKFLKWAMFRGRITLRVSAKMKRLPRKVAFLEGYCLPDATIKDLRHWVIYETVGGREYWSMKSKGISSWLIHLIYQLRTQLRMRSGKKLLLKS